MKFHLHPNTKLILGPPGTGKTTRLLNIVEKELSRDIDPERIAFVSFTRKAAGEAKMRAVKKFGLLYEDLTWFRTIHSFAYECLGLSHSEFFSNGHCKEFGHMIGSPISQTTRDGLGDNQYMFSKGSVMLAIDKLARNRMDELRITWESVADDRISWAEMRYFHESFLVYKKERGVLDYEDMITRWTEDIVVGGKVGPDLEVVIIDEAQDLSRLQWQMIKGLVKGKATKRVFVAGDDDQAIYGWSGSDIDFFLGLQTKKTIVLDHSYRFGQVIYDTAISISSRIHSRYKKDWGPSDKEGSISIETRLDVVGLGSGEWYVLSRNRCFLEEVEEFCFSSGYSFMYMDSEKTNLMDKIKAIRIWEKITAKKGKRISGSAARLIYEYLRVGSGFRRGNKLLPSLSDHDRISYNGLVKHHGLRASETWDKVFEHITEHERGYILRMLGNREKADKPRIILSTIHGAKGGEADNVLLLTDITWRVKQNLMDEHKSDEEHRVFYVGATRSKSHLVLLSPRSDLFYPVIKGKEMSLHLQKGQL